jgi:hypothetical protein
MCIHPFSDSKVRKQIGFRRERASAGEEGQRCTDSLYQCSKEEGGGDPKEGRGGGLEEGDSGGTDVQ